MKEEINVENITAIKATVAAVIGCLTALWGWMGWLVVGWVFLMLLDYITGSAAAMKAGEWSSKIAREGIWHKAGMIVVVILAAAADLLLTLVFTHLPILELPFEFAGIVCPLMLVWYCITELGSLCENAAAMGAPVPGWIIKFLAAGKKTVDKVGESLSTDHAVDEE